MKFRTVLEKRRFLKVVGRNELVEFSFRFNKFEDSFHHIKFNRCLSTPFRNIGREIKMRVNCATKIFQSGGKWMKLFARGRGGGLFSLVVKKF